MLLLNITLEKITRIDEKKDSNEKTFLPIILKYCNLHGQNSGSKYYFLQPHSSRLKGSQQIKFFFHENIFQRGMGVKARVI